MTRLGSLGLATLGCLGLGCGRLLFEIPGEVPLSDAQGSSDGSKANDARLNSPDASQVRGCMPPEIPGSFNNNYDDGMPPSFETYATAPAQVLFQNGAIRAVPGASVASAFAGAASRGGDNFRNRRVFTEVTRMVNPAALGQARFIIASTSQPALYIELAQSRGRITASSWSPVQQTVISNRPYNPVEDHWWQMRERNGTVLFETSRDGIHWRVLGISNTPAWYLVSHLEFSAGTSTLVNGDIGEAHFDNTFDCIAP